MRRSRAAGAAAEGGRRTLPGYLGHKLGELVLRLSIWADSETPWAVVFTMTGEAFEIAGGRWRQCL